MPLLYRFSFPSSGNASKISKFYFLLLANYKRIRGTILIHLGFRYFSNGIGVALENWATRYENEERTLRETRIGHATPIVERYFKLPIQFWRSIESGIFNFLCNDHFHFPLNRASSCSGGQFHRNTGVLPISRWFWFTYDSISNDSLLDGNFNSRRIISTMHHVENSRGKIFRWITQVTGRDKVDSRVWIKRNKFTVWNVRNISRKSILVWTGFPCTIYRSGIGARGCLENVEEVNKNQKGKTRREK